MVGSGDDLWQESFPSWSSHPELWDGSSMPSSRLSPLIVLFIGRGRRTWWPGLMVLVSDCRPANLQARLAPASRSPQKPPGNVPVEVHRQRWAPFYQQIGEGDVMLDHEISWQGGNRRALVAPSLVRTGMPRQEETFSSGNPQKLVRNVACGLLLPLPLTRIHRARC